MSRRAFITLLAGAAAWPLAARGQQPERMQHIGVLISYSLDQSGRWLIAAFREGLRETGYEEGRNVEIDYRSAEGRYDRLPELAADLVRRRVTVIAAVGGSPAALAAKSATASIPIVFQVGVDPVEIGLVPSFNQPGGNVTGIANLSLEVGPKRLELLHGLVPAAAVSAVLVNPNNPSIERQMSDIDTAARTLGRKVRVLKASTEREIDGAFVSLGQAPAGGLMISGDPFFNSRSEQLAAQALRHAVPAIFQFREFTAAGGLISYGGSLTDTHRLAGVYAGRVLKGEKPADLAVQQSTKIELIVNLKTAKSLRLDIPPTLLARADEVIE
jgi:putative ABC transport system substrate-binding protein